MNRKEYNRLATKKHIETMLISLLEQGVQLHQLSTSRLCQECGIAKSTFYLYFPDKYAVLEEIVSNVNDDLYHINMLFETYSVSDIVAGKPTPIAQKMVAYLSENKKILRVLLSPAGAPDFLYQNKETIEKKFKELYQALHLPPRHEALVSSYFFSGVAGLFRFYLFENTTYSDEQMVIILGNMLKASFTIADNIDGNIHNITNLSKRAPNG